jgi:hypothetical protein
MRLAARSTVIASALAVVAITAQAAPARFDLEPQQQVYVNPSTGYATPVPTPQSQPTAPRPEVHSNLNQQTDQAGDAGMPPILQRAPASELAAINRAQTRKARALSYSPSATARHSSADTDAYAKTDRSAAVTGPTVETPSNGFDYGDAAIGAGITAAIALLITAGTLTVRQRRQLRHP